MSSRAFNRGPVLTAAVMLVIFMTMTLMALGFPEKARLMPLLVGIPGTILALIQLFNELRAPLADDETSAAQQGAANWNERHMFAWLLVYFFGILGFGFNYAAPCLVFGFLYFGKKESAKAAVIGAVATWAILYGLFEQAFEIPLFDGLVLEWLLT